MKALEKFGEYVILMLRTLTIPERWSVFFRQMFKEIYKLGVDSLWIVIFISVLYHIFKLVSISVQRQTLSSG